MMLYFIKPEKEKRYRLVMNPSRKSLASWEGHCPSYLNYQTRLNHKIANDFRISLYDSI